MPDGSVEMRCKDHLGTVAVARCGACGRGLCGACFRFRVGGRPGCVRCAYEASTRPARRVSLAASFLCIALGGAFWATQRYDLLRREPILPGLTVLAAMIAAFFIAASGRNGDAAVERREEDEDVPVESLAPLAVARGVSPYRAHVRRVLLAASPRISGTATALVVLASLAASAVLLPASVRLPRWVEAELVLALWWVIVATALTVLLYRGFRLRDDYVYFVPWDRPAAEPGAPRARGGSSWGLDGFDGCSGCGDFGDGEGFLVGVAVVVALVAAFGAAWVFVELVMPVAFLLMYWFFMRAIGRAARDRRDCQGELAKSLGWGALWATVYVVPVAALTWVAHAVHHVR